MVCSDCRSTDFLGAPRGCFQGKAVMMNSKTKKAYTPVTDDLGRSQLVGRGVGVLSNTTLPLFSWRFSISGRHTSRVL